MTWPTAVLLSPPVGRESKVAHLSFLNIVSKSFFSIVTIIKFAALAAVAKLVDALL